MEKCLEFQRVKEKHRNMVGLLQHHVIIESKWESTSMDLFVRQVMKERRHDSIFVVMDTLCRITHILRRWGGGGGD